MYLCRFDLPFLFSVQRPFDECVLQQFLAIEEQYTTRYDISITTVGIFKFPLRLYPHSNQRARLR